MPPPSDHVDALIQSIMAMARMDFEVEAPELGEDPRLDALAAGLNLLREELQASTQSTSHLQRVIQAMGNGLLVVAPDGRISEANERASELLAVPLAELVGAALPDHVPDLDWEATLAQSRGAATTGDYPVAGGATEARLTFSPMPSLGTVVVCADISAQKALHAALREARDEAVRLSEQRARFVANMSHEIRTPIHGVLGMSDLLMGTELDPIQADMAGTIQLSARALLDVVNDVLDFSRIDSGQLTLETIEFDPRDLVDDVLEMQAVHLRGRPIRLLGTVSAAMPPLLLGDPTRLRQILTNLVGNAVKFTQQGEIAITAWPTGPSGQMVFEVRDTGCGVPQERIPELFHPFVQADDSTTRTHGGTGLGLAISRQLADLMSGSLTCESTLGVGSAFRLSVPLGVSARTPGDELDLAGMRVLVVDDNQVSRKYLAGQLKAWGAVPTVAASAAEAIGILREANAHRAAIPLAVIDMQMPGLDGLGLASAVRAESRIKTPKFLMLSSLDQTPTRDALEGASVSRVLHKPVRSKLLRTAIGGLIAGRRRESPQLRHSFAHARVLVAEDNPINQQVVLGYLHRLGIEAVCVADGRQAVAAMDQTWDLVLMDVRMPEMDGFQATRAIRALGISTPILALSADVLADSQARSIEVGMNGFLPKPVTEEALVRALKLWLSDPGAASLDPEDTSSALGREALIDPEAVGRLRNLASMSGQASLLHDLIDQFASHLPSQIDAMEAASGGSDPDQVSHIAHALRGSAATLGAVRVAAVAAQIERDPSSHNVTQSLASLRWLEQPTVSRLKRTAGADP